MPFDIGRLPSNIFDSGEEPSGVTAAQWKLYIITYARPCLYKLLPDRAYKCLSLLSEIVTLVVSPVFCQDTLENLFRLLHDHHLLFSQVYGVWRVTINYHMCLHLPEVILDLCPPQSFWCFAYECHSIALIYLVLIFPISRIISDHSYHPLSLVNIRTHARE